MYLPCVTASDALSLPDFLAEDRKPDPYKHFFFGGGSALELMISIC